EAERRTTRFQWLRAGRRGRHLEGKEGRATLHAPPDPWDRGTIHSPKLFATGIPCDGGWHEHTATDGLLQQFFCRGDGRRGFFNRTSTRSAIRVSLRNRRCRTDINLRQDYRSI